MGFVSKLATVYLALPSYVEFLKSLLCFKRSKKKFIKRALCIKINLVYRSIFSTCLFVCCCLFYHELLDFDRINLVSLGVVGCL